MRFNRTAAGTAALVFGLIAAGCGGGGGGGGGTGETPAPAPAPGPSPAPAPTTNSPMTCAETGAQCSGAAITAISAQGVLQTAYGTQVIAKSTTSETVATTPDGLALISPASTSGAPVAEVRSRRDANSAFSGGTLILSNLGVKWGLSTGADRPPIIEPFATTIGRTVLTAANVVDTTVPLPALTNGSFYDNPPPGNGAGTQANYANNRYFTTGVSTWSAAALGDWRNGSSGSYFPDSSSASRNHNDGDVFLNASPNGPAADDTKGYRSAVHYNLQNVNLAGWQTIETVNIPAWISSGGNSGLKTARYGVVAYGAVSAPDTVPTTGTVTYRGGWVYGVYAASATGSRQPFIADVSVTASLASGQVSVTVSNARTFNAAATPLPVNFTSTSTVGTVRNAFAGAATASTGSLSGGVAGHFYGTSTAAGGGGTGPTEIGGTFRMSDAGTGAAVIGGFMSGKKPAL